MEDLLEIAIDALLRSAGGDIRKAMRAILIESVKLQAELDRRDGASRNDSGKAVLH
jgi:hypothetical protein